MFDITVIGDTTIDVFAEIDQDSAQCTLDRTSSHLCFQYGSKIPVKQMTTVIGVGNAANVAVAMARFGARTALYTILGSDVNGRAIYKKFTRAKISSRYIRLDKEKGTNYSTVIEYKGDRTILAYHEKRHYQLPRLAKTSWIYFSSISGNHDEFNQELCSYLAANKHVRLGFNPGTLQMNLGEKRLRGIFGVTAVLFVNKEEAQRLVGEKKDMGKLLMALHKKGPRIVVVTDGKCGSYCFDGTQTYFFPIFDVPVIQRTGCGDAYASGFLAALMHERSVPEAMRWGTMNAASVSQRIGSQAGLLSEKEMGRLLAAYPQMHPVVLSEKKLSTSKTRAV